MDETQTKDVETGKNGHQNGPQFGDFLLSTHLPAHCIISDDVDI